MTNEEEIANLKLAVSALGGEVQALSSALLGLLRTTVTGQPIQASIEEHLERSTVSNLNGLLNEVTGKKFDAMAELIRLALGKVASEPVSPPDPPNTP